MYTLLAICFKHTPVQLTITSDPAAKKDHWDSVDQKANLLKDIKCKPSDKTRHKMQYIELCKSDNYEDLIKIKFIIDYVNCRDKGISSPRLVAFVDGEVKAETEDVHGYLYMNRIQDPELVVQNPTIQQYFGRVFGEGRYFA